MIPKPPPYRPAIDIDHPLQRIGKPYVRIDPEKIVAVVETNQCDELGGFPPLIQAVRPLPDTSSISCIRNSLPAASLAISCRCKVASVTSPTP
jgi:hypothetical protein